MQLLLLRIEKFQSHANDGRLDKSRLYPHTSSILLEGSRVRVGDDFTFGGLSHRISVLRMAGTIKRSEVVL